jgi:hypothetical protein
MQKVKYKVWGMSLNLKNRGKRVSRIITLDIPDDILPKNFDSYPSDNGIDFRDYREDISPIIDWEVVKDKPKTSKAVSRGINPVIEFANHPEISEEIRLPYIQAYESMKKTIDGLSTEKQIEIVLAAINLSLRAAKESYSSMERYRSKLRSDLDYLKKMLPLTHNHAIDEYFEGEKDVDLLVRKHVIKKIN